MEPLGLQRIKDRRLLYWVAAVVASLVCLAIGLWTYSELTLQKPLNRVLLGDPRNRVVQAHAHFDNWVDTKTVVFDITDLSGEASNLDVFRVFVQFAQSLQGQRFNKVILASYSNKKFVLAGEYFQQLGREYSTQNPIYTIRTFPTHLMAMDGSQPFPPVDGGWLYVLPKELENFKTFNERWFLNDYMRRAKHG